MQTVLERRGSRVDVAERGGNAGAMENVENQTAVSHVSHRPLEIAQSAIPTFPPRRRRFPLLGNPKTKTQRLAPFGRSPQYDERRIHPRQRANPVFHSSGACLDWKTLAKKKLAETVSGRV
jgi:hypothetical protein